MKKSISLRRVLSVLAIIAIMLLCVTGCQKTGSVSESKNSVVVVIGQNGGQGTGFAIGEVGEPVEYIVTNNHVVEGDQFTTATVAFDLASDDMVMANVHFYDAARDVAILKLPQPTEKRQAMVICPMEDVDPDDSFAALGYPGNQVTDWPKYNMDDITVTKGGIKKADRIDGLDVYMLDIVITHGNSGGPLVNSAGEVVGINTFGINDDNYAIAIDEVLRVIDGRVPVTMHGGINWILIAVIAAVLLVVIVLAIILVVRSGKKKNDVVPPVYVNDNNPTMPVEPIAEKVGARVVAIGGTLNGKRFSVNGTVRIGRDASRCAIAFPVSTQGVSAVHCEISSNGSVCYLKDLNSSYGTFTIDGQRLEPNTPIILKSGDKFYLASPENTFEVRI